LANTRWAAEEIIKPFFLILEELLNACKCENGVGRPPLLIHIVCLLVLFVNGGGGYVILAQCHVGFFSAVFEESYGRTRN
jgi:hypothetical protein